MAPPPRPVRTTAGTTPYRVLSAPPVLSAVLVVTGGPVRAADDRRAPIALAASTLIGADTRPPTSRQGLPGGTE
ncbi:hypothetical protein GCM10022252_43280 [Streptosporangium oxazolinicum]|uniref:Uncharacterized protein n=1 Tax=Streptosporangium oxazolinicum TaxID=909287 RepID=A0ABP8B227_9ACTN